MLIKTDDRSLSHGDVCVLIDWNRREIDFDHTRMDSSWDLVIILITELGISKGNFEREIIAVPPFA